MGDYENFAKAPKEKRKAILNAGFLCFGKGFKRICELFYR